MKFISNIALAVVLSVGLSACSASATMKVEKPKAEAIPSNSSVALQVTSAPDDGGDEVAQKLLSELSGHLLIDGIFRQVVNAPGPADYTMVVTVDGVRTVSRGARFMVGVMAGENKLTAHCDVKNAATNAEVAKFDVAGESASHPLASENDMDAAISKVVEQIIAALR